MTEEENLPPVPEVDETVLSRRAVLARLGFAVSAVYVAPTILHIDRSANAFVVPSPCSSGRGRRCRKKGGKNKSSKGKSKGGGRSGRGRQSRNNRRRNNSRRRQANNRRRRNSGGTNRRRW